MKNARFSFSMVIVVVLGSLATPAQAQFTITDIYDFNVPANAYPFDFGQLTIGADGNLYGTEVGGSNDGAVFMTSPDGATYNQWLFDGTNGSGPEAALTLAQDGNFYGTATDGNAEHKTKASVRELAEQALEHLNRNQPEPLGITRLGDFVDRLYLPFIKQQKRPSTYRGYLQMWERYIKQRCETAWMREVKTHDVQGWLEDIGREHGISRTTLKHLKNFLSGIFRHAAQQGYFDGANPVKLAEVPAFAPSGAETKSYSLEEIAMMLKVLPEPSAMAVATAAFTGMRLGEIRGLIWESYKPAEDDETFGWMDITRSVWRNTVGDPKTAKSKAPVPVIPQLAKRLATHRKACGGPLTGPIFANSAGNPLDLNACYQREMKDVLKRAGITWHGWHGFRRGLASNLNRLGVDDSVIQRIPRHSNVATTQNHYIKTALPDAIAAMKQFSEALACSICAPDNSAKDERTIQYVS